MAENQIIINTAPFINKIVFFSPKMAWGIQE